MPMGAPAHPSVYGTEAERGMHTGVTGVGLADDIGGEGANGRDGDVVCRVCGELGHGGRRRKGGEHQSEIGLYTLGRVTT